MKYPYDTPPSHLLHPYFPLGVVWVFDPSLAACALKKPECSIWIICFTGFLGSISDNERAPQSWPIFSIMKCSGCTCCALFILKHLIVHLKHTKCFEFLKHLSWINFTPLPSCIAHRTKPANCGGNNQPAAENMIDWIPMGSDQLIKENVQMSEHIVFSVDPKEKERRHHLSEKPTSSPFSFKHLSDLLTRTN